MNTEIQALGNLPQEFVSLIRDIFEKNSITIEFNSFEELDHNEKIISFDKEASEKLRDTEISFFNWDLLFSVLGPNDTNGEIEEKLQTRIDILKSVLNVKARIVGEEFHGSIRVHDLAKSSAFYSWLFGVEPKEWTHRYVTFVRPDTKFNFVLLVSDGKELHHDTLYHLGMGVQDKEEVVRFYHSAKENGFEIVKPPRTTWRGTPLHELWLKDPDGTAIEVYARLTESELREMPEDKEPFFLVPGTEND